jgi:hypothetical protein
MEVITANICLPYKYILDFALVGSSFWHIDRSNS